MSVRDVLRAKGNNEVFTISPTATIVELLEQLTTRNVGAIVVLNEDDSLLGIATERDLVRKLPAIPHPLQARVEQIMSTELIVCGPEDSFGRLMATMTEKRIRHIPVVEDGKVSVWSASAMRSSSGWINSSSNAINSPTTSPVDRLAPCHLTCPTCASWQVRCSVGF